MTEAIDQLWCKNVADSVWNNFISGKADLVLRSVWTVGFFGNLLNILVFSHKRNTISSPGVKLFLWLSITDLFELVAVALHSYTCEWCTIMDTFLPEAFIFWTIGPYSDEPAMMLRVSYFLLQLFHTVGVGLNMSLSVAYPRRQPINFCDYWPVGSTVLSLYIIGYILGLPVLVISSKKKVPMGETRFIEIVDYSYTAYSMVVRVLPFVILVILSIMLVFALFKRFRLSRQQEAVQEANVRREYVHQSTLILVILLVYLITDLPSIMWFFSPDYYSQCFRMIRHLQQLFFLVNCSYNVCIYLLLCPQYRATLKLMLDTCANRICGNAPADVEEIELQ